MKKAVIKDILDSDVHINDSTCVMQGTIIHNDILKKDIVASIRQVRKIVNHPFHIFLDVSRLHSECMKLEDISSYEEDDLPEPGTLSTHNPKKDYSFYPKIMGIYKLLYLVKT